MLIRAVFWIINKIISLIGVVLNSLICLFPTSPFRLTVDSQFNDFISQINYFIPVYEFIAILELWLVAVASYYIYSIWARWIKAIE